MLCPCRINQELSELRDARHKRANLGILDVPSDEKKTASRQAMDKLLEEALRKAGLDLDKVEALRKQSESEMLERIAKLRAEADEQDSAREETVRRAINNWRNAIVQFTTPTPPADSFQRFLLNTASEIFSTSRITLASKQIAPANNTAQFKLQTKQTVLPAEEVSFGFFWQNPSDKYALINVDGYLVLTGLCRATSEGGTFPDDRECSLSVDANLHLHELWNQPPTTYDQSQNALTLSVESGGFNDPRKTIAQNLFRGFDLQYTLVLVPPNGALMFEVACSLRCKISHGEADYTFQVFGRQAMCPGLLITLLT